MFFDHFSADTRDLGDSQQRQSRPYKVGNRAVSQRICSGSDRQFGRLAALAIGSFQLFLSHSLPFARINSGAPGNLLIDCSVSNFAAWEGNDLRYFYQCRIICDQASGSTGYTRFQPSNCKPLRGSRPKVRSGEPQGLILVMPLGREWA